MEQYLIQKTKLAIKFLELVEKEQIMMLSKTVSGFTKPKLIEHNREQQDKKLKALTILLTI